MLMTPPSGGDSFAGLDGTTVTAATGVMIEVSPGNQHQAFLRNWTSNASLKQVPVYEVVPVTGFAIQIPNGCTALLLNPAGTLATGAVTMPPNPASGDKVSIHSSQTVTALTLNASSGQSFAGTPPTTITSGAAIQYTYNSSASKWMRTT